MRLEPLVVLAVVVSSHAAPIQSLLEASKDYRHLEQAITLSSNAPLIRREPVSIPRIGRGNRGQQSEDPQPVPDNFGTPQSPVPHSLAPPISSTQELEAVNESAIAQHGNSRVAKLDIKVANIMEKEMAKARRRAKLKIDAVTSLEKIRSNTLKTFSDLMEKYRKSKQASLNKKAEKLAAKHERVEQLLADHKKAKETHGNLLKTLEQRKKGDGSPSVDPSPAGESDVIVVSEDLSKVSQALGRDVDLMG